MLVLLLIGIGLHKVAQPQLSEEKPGLYPPAGGELSGVREPRRPLAPTSAGGAQLPGPEPDDEVTTVAALIRGRQSSISELRAS